MNQTPERINIKDLVIDTPDQTRHGLGFFNVQEAIGDKRWADMLSSLRIDLGSEAYYDYLTLLANMAFLCPERQLPDIDADLQESLRKSAGQIPLFSLKSIHAEKFCRIFPDYFESHLRQDPDFQEAKARLEPDINKPGSLGMLDLEAAEAHKILDPENPVALDDDVLQRWVRHYNNTDFETGVLIAADLRILWPERFGEFDLSPIRDRMEVLKDIAELSRYAQVCRNLAIISANELEFSNHQLKLVNRSSLQEPAHGLPQTRRF